MDQLSREQFRAGGAAPEHAWEHWVAFHGARRAWPDIELPLESFEAHLSAVGWRLGSDANASSLYLCAGCARQLPAAVQALEDAYLRPLRVMVRRIVRQAHAVEEVMQDLRNRLLVRPKPRIGMYRGVGPLQSWLRVTAERIALDHRRAQAARRRGIQALRRELESTPPSPSQSPEHVADRELERTCERLLHRVILALPEPDKQLLYHHFVAGLSIDVLGAMYGVNRSTVARRIQRALRRIRESWSALVARQVGNRSVTEGRAILQQLHARLELDLASALSSAEA